MRITIENPCSQSWDEMIPTANGNYCNHCEKVVVDFTDMSASELQNWFVANDKNICGRLLPSQLIEYKNKSVINWKAISARLLIASSLTFTTNFRVNAAEVKVEKSTSRNTQHDYNTIDVENLEVFRLDSVVVIKGKVTENPTNLPLKSAKISIYGMQEQTFSDEKGNFYIQVEAAENQSLKLIISCLGFNVKEVEINNSRFFPVVVKGYQSVRSTSIVGNLTVVLTDDLRKKQHWYQRVWYFVKRQFK